MRPVGQWSELKKNTPLPFILLLRAFSNTECPTICKLLKGIFVQYTKKDGSSFFSGQDVYS